MTARKKSVLSQKGVVVFRAKSGAIELRTDAPHETVWATLDQIAALFGRDKSVISRHLKGVFESGELERKAVVAKNATTAADGKTYQVEYFNLDAILSVGYRVNSKMATRFRQWATKTLRGYITQGYVIDRKRVAKNFERFSDAVRTVQRLLPAASGVDSESALELVRFFADTWLSLDAYDRGAFPKGTLTKKRVALTAEKLEHALGALRTTLRAEGTASELFAAERERGSVAGIVGNVMQTFAGKELYPTVEEKAAHLMYFMVKNHPFADGNKRSGAYAFVWFLKVARILDERRLTTTALTALTLLVAESDPHHKERVIELIVALVR